MKIYRWYILADMLCCSIAKVVMVSTKMVVLSPLPIAIVIGPLENIFASNVQFLILVAEFILYVIINMIIVIIAAAFYRLSVLLNFTKVVPLFENWRCVVVWVTGYQSILLGCLYVLIERHRGGNEYFILDENFVKENANFLMPLMQEHRIYGFLDNTISLDTSLIVAIVLMLLAFSLAIFLSLLPKFFIERTKPLRSSTTYKMQLMLFKSVLIQGWNFMILVMLSATLIFVIILFKIRGTAILVQLLLLCMELHGVVDLCSIMYFITPYRKFIKEKIPFFKNSVQIIHVPPSTTLPNETVRNISQMNNS